MGTLNTESDIDNDNDTVDPLWEPAQLQKAYEKNADDDLTSTQQYDGII